MGSLSADNLELVSFCQDESPIYYIEGGAAPSGTTSSVFEIPIGKNSQALSAPLAVVNVLKKLDLRCVQAATAFTGGPVERTGPDFRQVSGNRRKASKFRKRAASASLTGVRVAAGRQPPRRIRARVCGSALAVSRTNRVRAI